MLSIKPGLVRTALLAASVCLAVGTIETVAQAKSAAAPKPPASTPIAWDQLEEPIQTIHRNGEIYARDHALTAVQNIDHLEGLANEAVLANLIKSIYTQAAEQKWTQTESFRIFPMEHLLRNSARETPVTFNPNGMRVAVFALRLGRDQRGILLSSSFQSRNPAELRSLYMKNQMIPAIDGAQAEFRNLAAQIIERMRSGDSRQSRHVPVAGSGDAWFASCQATVAGHFCLNANLFDSAETSPITFVSALSGGDDDAKNVALIREQNLAWPIEKTFISRGFRICSTGCQHLGLDLTAPVGTPVHAVARGTVLHAKSFSGWGQAVVLLHDLPDGSKYVSLYAHLSQFRRGLKPGEIIERGEIIAKSGRTGASATGAAIPPHLHLEIRNAPDGKEPLEKPKTAADRPIDPMRVLDLFNVFVGAEQLTPEAGEVIEYRK